MPAPTLRYELLATDGGARRGRVVTRRGSFETPVFMPVGTRGTVVHLDADDYERLGLEVVLANTYHLMLRPGPDTIAEVGGLHAFCGWDGHMLTDSGGFQVMSLGRRTDGRPRRAGAAPESRARVDDDGVTFRSVYDGTEVRLTPEAAVDVQRRIGADIQMALDVCPELPASDEAVRLAMRRTHDWAARAHAAHAAAHADGQALFGIVQGGIDVGLRRHSAETLAELDFPGYGIGGLSVGETRTQTVPALRAVTDVLPADRPRYLMGVGDPARIVDAIGAGVDMFDCVLPTRLARHGTALTAEGRLNLRNARFAGDAAPLQPDSPTAARFSRAYLRHLLRVGEPTAARAMTLHNLWFLTDLVARARAAVSDGRFAAFRDETTALWSQPESSPARR